MTDRAARQRGGDGVAPFLAHLEPRDHGAARLALRLLDSDWQVESCWGPEQMDVWELVLGRRSWRVRFGIERGLADGVMAWRESDDGSRETVYVRMSDERFGDLIEQVSAGDML